MLLPPGRRHVGIGGCGWLISHDLIDISGSDGLEGSLSLDLFYCQYTKSVTIFRLVI